MRGDIRILDFITSIVLLNHTGIFGLFCEIVAKYNLAFINDQLTARYIICIFSDCANQSSVKCSKKFLKISKNNTNMMNNLGIIEGFSFYCKSDVIKHIIHKYCHREGLNYNNIYFRDDDIFAT